MAKTATANTKTNAKAQTQSVAHRAADAFDNAVATAKQDLARPAHQSTIKKTASVATVMGIGVAIGAWAF